MTMQKKTGSLIITKAADAGLDVAAVKALMEARGIDTEKIAPEVAASRFFRMIASTEDVDGIGDVVKSDGWDLSTWLENPSIFADHKQGLDGTAARGLQAFVDTNQKCLVIDGFFTPPELDLYGLAEFVMGLYQAGLAKGVSIGAIPTKYHWATKADETAYGPDVRRVWEKSKLLEVSFVGIPMNSHAIVARVAKSVLEGSMSSAMVSTVAEMEGEFGILAKAALWTVKAANPPEPPTPPRVEPPTTVVVNQSVPDEVKSMFEQMQAQLADQGRAIKRMGAKSGDVVHATAEDLQRALEYLGEAVAIIAGLMPEPEEQEDPPPTQDDAVVVDADKCDKSALQLQQLVEAVKNNHPELKN